MTFGQIHRIVVISVLIVLFWVWIDPAFAVVLGIISMTVLSVANLHPKPRWVRNFGLITLIWGSTTESSLSGHDPATMEG